MQRSLFRAFWWALRIVVRDAGKCRGQCNQGRRACNCKPTRIKL